MRKARSDKASPPIGPWVLRSATGAEGASFDKPSEFAEALSKAMSEAQRHRASVCHLGAECRNSAGFAQEPQARAHRSRHRTSAGQSPQACAIALVKREQRSQCSEQCPRDNRRAVRPKIDKSVLTFSEPKRIRCKEHLRFVASQPCLICGRSPLTPTTCVTRNRKDLSLKVSDEFTVPLCAIHHHHIHTTGKEREWWQERNIDPLIVAGRLWQQSRGRDPQCRS